MSVFEGQIWLSNRLTIMEWLNNSIKKYGSKIAIVDGEAYISYVKLKNMIDHYSGYFFQEGIKKGDRVVIQLNNSKEYVYAVLSLIQIGAIPVLTNYALREKEVNGIIERTQASAYVYSEISVEYSYKKFAENAKEKYDYLFLCNSVENIEINCKKNISFIPVKSKLNDIAVLMLSGGTTGTPKIVPLLHDMLYWHIKCYIDKFGLDENSVYLGILPFTHKFALYSPGLLNMLFVGGTIVMSKTSSFDESFSLIEKERVTITGIVPSLAQLWIEVLMWDNSYDLKSLERIIIGGALINKKLIADMINVFSCDIHIGYGATEGIVMYSLYDSASNRLSSGYKYPISGCEDIKIIDSDEKEVEIGQPGELVIKSPYTITQYYNAADNTSEKFTFEGYYRTGDKAVINLYGEYEIIGRIVDQINKAGEKINPQELEQYLYEHIAIKEAVVVGVKDELLGERICAFIIPTQVGQDIDVKELINFLEMKGIAHYKIPDQIECIDKFPLTPVNKIDKEKLRYLAEVSRGEGIC